MAFLPFQQGQQFTQQRALQRAQERDRQRAAALEQERARQRNALGQIALQGREALVDERGAAFGDLEGVGLASTVDTRRERGRRADERLDLQQQQGQRAQERLDLQRRQAEAQEQRTQTRFGQEQEARRRALAARAIQGLQQSVQGLASPDERAQRVERFLSIRGVGDAMRPEQRQQLRDIAVTNPGQLDSVRRALTGEGAAGGTNRQIIRTIPTRRQDGSLTTVGVRRDGTTVDLGVEPVETELEGGRLDVSRLRAALGQVEEGARPTDFDEQGVPTRVQPIGGSELERERAQETRQRRRRQQEGQRRSTQFQETVDRAITAIEENPTLTTGVIGQLTQFVGGTPARDLNAFVSELQSLAGFERLSQMRRNSPTGGALGNVSNAELRFLQAALGDIDISQSPDQLTEQLRRAGQAFDTIVNGPDEEIPVAAQQRLLDFMGTDQEQQAIRDFNARFGVGAHAVVLGQQEQTDRSRDNGNAGR